MVYSVHYVYSRVVGSCAVLHGPLESPKGPIDSPDEAKADEPGAACLRVLKLGMLGSGI